MEKIDRSKINTAKIDRAKIDTAKIDTAKIDRAKIDITTRVFFLSCSENPVWKSTSEVLVLCIVV